MSQIHLLYRLQQIDLETKEKKERLRDVLRAQQQNAPLLAARKRAAEAEAALQSLRTQQKDLELDMGTVSAKAQHSEQRMYSGKVTNPKELADLQHEVEALGRRRRALEDDVLEVMVMREEAEVEQQKASDTLQALETNWAAELKRLQAEQNSLALRINELTALRNELVQQIDGRMLKAYDSTGRNRKGIAVAILHNGSCKACGVTASSHKVKAAEQGDLVYCGTCGRILYVG